MFKTGDLVEHAGGYPTGVVVDTKIKFLEQYCKVAWACPGTEDLEWIHHHRLYLKQRTNLKNTGP